MRKIYVQNDENTVTIACVEEGRIERFFVLDVDSPVGSIYRGKVMQVTSAGAFVDIDRKKNGFLPKREGLNPGDYVTVMVEREEKGDKGCLLTEDISLSGKFSIVNTSGELTFSRKISAKKRAELTEYFDGQGILFRSACEGADVSDIEWEVERNVFALNTIVDNGKNTYKVELLYRYDPINVAHELATDGEINYSFEEIEELILGLTDRKVDVNEAELVFDYTEAMTVIDVNSHAEREKFADPLDMAYYVDMLAAKEVARQIKLRNIGGLIAVDFINIKDEKRLAELETALRDELSKDFVKTELEFAKRTCVALITRTKRYGK